MTQNLKIRAYLMQKFMEFDMKKISQSLTFGVCGLKPNLGQFEPKAFGKGLIKPLAENPSSSFYKQDPHFLQNHGMNTTKL